MSRGWERVAGPSGPGARGLALGTVQWGQTYGIANRTGQPGEQAVVELLTVARRAGVFLLDTARAYGDSEELIGRLAAGDRDWFVLTKLDPAAQTAAAAAASLEASRRALRRPALDGVLLHRAEQRTADQGRLWDYLRGQRDQARVGALGVSAGSPDEAWAALDDPDVQCLQVASSLFDQRLARGGFFERAKTAGKVVLVRSVFLQGAAHLPAAELPAHLLPLRAPLATIDAQAQRHQATRAQLFLAFAARLAGAWILTGCESVSQLEQNLADWAAARALGAAVEPLAATLPELPPAVLNPALWPARS